MLGVSRFTVREEAEHMETVAAVHQIAFNVCCGFARSRRSSGPLRIILAAALAFFFVGCKSGDSPPLTKSFTTSSRVLTVGDSATLAWVVTGATALRIDEDVGTVTGSSVQVKPKAPGSTTYTLFATNSVGRVESLVTLIVADCDGITLCHEIQEASAGDDLGTVSALLKEKPDLAFTKDRSGITPLHVAALSGQTQVVDLLLANKADVNARDGKGMTPLHLASESGQTRVVDRLLKHHADVNAKSNSGMTPLHLAAESGQKPAVELLLANRADVHASSEDVGTPLHVAVVGGHLGIANLLLARGAQVNARDAFGMTPLHDAAMNGLTDLARLLLVHRAEVDAKATGIVYPGGLKFGSGMTPLHFAVLGDHQAVSELLLSYKADIDARDATGMTPLHWVASLGRKNMIELLVAHKADINAKDHQDRTPLYMAVQNQHTEVAALLAANKADDVFVPISKDVDCSSQLSMYKDGVGKVSLQLGKLACGIQGKGKKTISLLGEEASHGLVTVQSVILTSKDFGGLKMTTVQSGIVTTKDFGDLRISPLPGSVSMEIRYSELQTFEDYLER
jgi:ankyrin repeat protein